MRQAEGKRQTQREFSRVLRDGTLRPSAGLKITRTDAKVLRQLVEQAKESASRAISIRIPVSDLERAKQIAQRPGSAIRRCSSRRSARV
jgi:hypothetical protein